MSNPIEDPASREAGASPDPSARARQQSGTRQLLLARAWFIITGYGVTIILARGLGPTEYGIYGVLMSVLLWLEMVSSAGVQAAAGRLMPHSPGREPLIEGTARFILLMIGMGLFALCWFAAPIVSGLLGIPNGTTLFRIAVVDIPFMALYTAERGILTGHRRFGALAASQAIYGMAKLVGVTILLLLGLSVATVLIVNVLATWAPLIYLRVRNPSFGMRARASVARQLVSLAIPMGAYLIALQVAANVPLWGLQGLWRGEGAVVGHFVAALQIARMLTVIPVVQSGVVFASVGWALAHGNHDAARDHLVEGSRFALIIIAPACVIMGIDAAPLLSLLFSEQYVDGASFLSLQLVGFAAYALADTYSHALMAAGRHAIVARVFLALVPASILVTFLLLRAAGPVGAAASLALIMIVGATWVGALALRRFGALISVGTVARLTLAIVPIAVAGVALEVTGAWLLLKMMVLGGLYLLLLWLLGEISPSDFKISRVGPNPDVSPGGEGNSAL